MLEAAAELGEVSTQPTMGKLAEQADPLTLYQIGAGIQMTPNVSRLLIKWGVDKIIGDDLVQCSYINMRDRYGNITQRTELVPKTVREYGFPVSLHIKLHALY